MKRLATTIFAALAIAAAASPIVAQAQQGIAERTEAKVDALLPKLDQILQLLQAGKPPAPVLPPAVMPTPVEPTPVEPVPPASGPSCNSSGPHLINGQGTLYNVCTCAPAVVRVTNVPPGSSLTWVKMPGTGLPAIPLGRVRMTEGGRPVGDGEGFGPRYDIGLGDRTYVLTAEVPCTNLSVQVR